MSDPEFNPFHATQAAVPNTVVARRIGPKRSLIVEVIETVVSMIAGALVGLLVSGNGLGYASFVILCSLLGWVLWSRRKSSIAGTIGICILMVIVWWPIGLVLRELGRELL